MRLLNYDNMHGMTSFNCTARWQHALLWSVNLCHPYLFGGESVLHEVETDGAHKFAVERARGNGNSRIVRHRLVRLAMKLIVAQFCRGKGV